MEAPYSETAELQARGPFLHGYHKSEKEKEGHRTGGGLFYLQKKYYAFCKMDFSAPML